MYGWLWQKLPGSTVWKAAQSAVLALAVLGLLFLVVFPWASQHVPFLRVTVEDPAAAQSHSVPLGGTTPSIRNSSTV
jgi:hypothetical protein